MIKILHIIRNITPGGAPRALATCAKRCMEMDQYQSHTVISLVPITEQEAYNIFHKAGLTILENPSISTIHNLIIDSDIVHLHFWNSPEMYELLYKSLPSMRLLIKFNIGGKYPPQVITKPIIEFADMIQTTGPLAHRLPIFDELQPEKRLKKVHMIYGAADFSRMENIKRPPHGDFNISYIGTVCFTKMHPDFISMSSKVSIPSSRFIVCGGGNAHAHLKLQAQKYGMENRVTIKHHIEEISQILKITDVFGYPLCRDNYSSGELILQEVAYAGIPAVVFPYGGAGLLVIDNYTGFVVHSETEYCNAVEYLYHHPEERKRLGDNARNYAKQIYGDYNAAVKTNELYSKILQLPKRQRNFQTIKLSSCPGFSSFAEQQKGTKQFIASLGEYSDIFEQSINKIDKLQNNTPEQAIKKIAPVMVESDGGLLKYSEKHNKDFMLHFWSGLTLMHQKKWDKAIIHFRNAIDAGFPSSKIVQYIIQSSIELKNKSVLSDITKMITTNYHIENPFDKNNKSVSFFDHSLCPNSPTDNIEMALEGENNAKRVHSDKNASYQKEYEIIENHLSIVKMNRDLLLAMNKLQYAEKISNDILKKDPEDKQNIESHYKIGLAYAKSGKYENAKFIFISILDKYNYNPEMSSWSAFKLGEILIDEGNNMEKIKELFLKAIQYKPDNFKAQILLTDTAPLIVNMDRSFWAIKPSCPDLQDQVYENENENEKNSFSGKEINIPMDIFDENLWEYYFGIKKINQITLPLYIGTSENDRDHLIKLLKNYTKKNAVIYLKLTGISIRNEKIINNNGNEHIQNIINSFHLNGLSFISIKQNTIKFQYSIKN